jgi:hypothetical protein
MVAGKEKALPGEKFYIPGSVLQVALDHNNESNWGMNATADVYFNASGILTLSSFVSAAGGGAAFRFDLIPADYNPGEQVLLEMLITGATWDFANANFFWGIGAGGHYSQVEWHGLQMQAVAGLTTVNYIARGLSTSGGARSVTIAAAQPISTNYLLSQRTSFTGSGKNEYH